METVLVTGGSGFIAGYVILKLLDAGYRVRTTVRSLSRKADVLAKLKKGGAKEPIAVDFFVADLTDDAGWAEAAAGCDFVMHVASPFPSGVPRNEDDLIVPARDGTLRVLRAARESGVKRVVVTSSFAAIGYGYGEVEKMLTEVDWTDPSGPDVFPYIKSKYFAERAAWDFVNTEGQGMELSVVNPVVVLGPILGPDDSTSIAMIRQLMKRLPGVPRIHLGLVDVRDVADLHLLAMTSPAARGERFLATAVPSISLLEIATILRKGLGERGKGIPTRELPDWLIHLAARILPMAKLASSQLGTIRNASNNKAKSLLNWQPRPVERTILDTAESLLQLKSGSPN